MSLKENAKTIAENVPKVYEAGELAGIKNESLWKSIQMYGSGYKPSCNYMFYGFNTSAFYPKYDFKPTSAAWFAREMKGDVIDLVERLAECGVSMDFSKCTDVTYAFYGCKFSRLPELDFRKAGATVQYLMFGKYVETIDKLILKETGTSCVDTFGYASALKNIVVEGVIAARTNVGCKGCKSLTLASAKSILMALEDVSGTDRAGLYTITLAPEVVALLEADGATAPNGLTWLEYVSAKGWLL